MSAIFLGAATHSWVRARPTGSSTSTCRHCRPRLTPAARSEGAVHWHEGAAATSSSYITHAFTRYISCKLWAPLFLSPPQAISLHADHRRSTTHTPSGLSFSLHLTPANPSPMHS